MKGATTEPCASTNNPPNINITIIMGANQNFFRTRRKSNNSFKKPIIIFTFNIAS